MKITIQEENIAREVLSKTLAAGATAARVTLNKGTMDEVGTLNGEIEHVTHCLDRSITLGVYIGGRYGTFSTNRFEEKELDEFIARAVDIAGMLQEDPCRGLPAPERKAKDALTGDELRLCDPAYGSVTAEDRVARALSDCSFGKEYEGWKIVSEECAYSDSLYDSLLLDSDGLYARHTETTFEYGADITIEDENGDKYSGYWWDAAPMLKDLHIAGCSGKAVARAAAQIGAVTAPTDTYRIVVDTECAAKLVTPLLNALAGHALQQNNSFLRDSLGKKMFSDHLTIVDSCRAEGQTGSRLFDSEGVATADRPIIENGVVKMYFINEYISRKMNVPGTVEDSTRAKVLPFPEANLSRADIVSLCGEGLLITGFNGGNCNSATGDFSYGVEGFLIKDGTIDAPVSELVITGNFLELWNNLFAAGSDARVCMSKLIPTLAFTNVEVSGL